MGFIRKGRRYPDRKEQGTARQQTMDKERKGQHKARSTEERGNMGFAHQVLEHSLVHSG
jgi:hypothetical protein